MLLAVVAAIAGAAFGAALGAGITWRMGRLSRELATQVSNTQQNIAKLEDEFSRWEFVRHLAPRAYLVGDPPEMQQVMLESDEPFRISSVDYLTGSGKPVVRQELQLQGKRISLPVDDQFVRAVLRIESNPWDGSGMIQFRFRAQIGDLEKDIVFCLSVVPEIKLGPAGRVTEFRKLVDPRTAPTMSALVN